MSASCERLARALRPLAAALACAGAPALLAAQAAEVCPVGEAGCARAAISAADARARAALAVSGGSPLTGSASTLGRRTATSRHAGVALRMSATGARALVPAAAGGRAAGEATLVGLSVDGAVALFDGFFVAPTVGGLLSVDLLGSAGWLGGGGPIDIDGAFTWGVGARVGVLRESFTLPGLSVSAVYRDVAALAAGDTAIGPAWAAETDAWSLRATVGKRIGAVDVLGGAGWDRTTGALSVTYASAPGTRESAGVPDLEDARWSGFAGIGWTFLVFQAAGEVGWVGGGDGYADDAGGVPAPEGGAFGSLAFRFTY